MPYVDQRQLKVWAGAHARPARGLCAPTPVEPKRAVVGVGVRVRDVVRDGVGGVQHEGEGAVSDVGEALGVPSVVRADVADDHSHGVERYARGVCECLSFSVPYGTIAA